MPHFDWTITAGNILTIGTLIGGLWFGATKAYYLLDKRIDRFEIMLKTHADTLVAHSDRMLRTEERFIDMAGTLQGVIGRLDVVTRWNGRDRRRDGSTD